MGSLVFLKSEKMSKANRHIEKYLCEYLGLEFSPGFAVLLQGEWGCGKTWFIKRFIEEFEKNKGIEDTKRVLYISLYAVNSTNEIEDQIFQQLHPVLSSKPMALTGKILKGVLRASLKIDLDADNKPEGTINAKIPDLNLPDYLMKTDDRILIFDDLERCQIPIEDVFGYINSFVEHQGLKVVIIANEDELNNIERNKEKDCPNYNRIKEKLIGKTFRVSHDIESAFNSFVGNIKDPKTKEFFLLNKGRVIEIFYIANYKNLRHLKQSIWDFGRLFSDIPQKYKDIPELMVDLLSVFMSFSFEIKGGKIIPDQIKNLTSILPSRFFPDRKKEKHIPTPMEEVIDKYSFLNPYDTVLTEKCWRELFDKGYFSKEELSDSLGKSNYCQDENTPDWVKLWHFTELNDDQFSSILENVKKQWNERAFKKPCEIMQVSGLYLVLSQMGLNPEKQKDILHQCKEYIDEVKKSGAWSNLNVKSISLLERDQGAGLGYAGQDLNEFNEIYLYLEKKLEEAKIESLPQAGEDLLRVLSEDTSKFRRMITLCNSNDQIYYETPILKYVDPKEFLGTIISLNNSEKRIVAYALKERYKFDEIASKIFEELDFLKSLVAEIDKEINKRKGKVSGYILQGIKAPYLLEAINRLEKTNKALSADS